MTKKTNIPTDKEMKHMKVVDRQKYKVPCKFCKKEIVYCDNRWRKKYFCSRICAIHFAHQENTKYTPEVVISILQELLEILHNNNDILFEKELYVLHSDFSDHQFYEWSKNLWPENPSILEFIKDIKVICETRQLKAGVFENVMIDAYTQDIRPMKWPDWKVLKDENGIIKYETVEKSVKMWKSVNSGFLKFVLANHSGYKTTVSDNQNKNLNSDWNDLQDVINATWEKEETKKEKSNF